MWVSLFDTVTIGVYRFDAVGEDQLGHAGEGAIDAALVACAPPPFLAVEPLFPERAVGANVARVAMEQLADIVEDKADMVGQIAAIPLWLFVAFFCVDGSRQVEG